MRRQVSLGQKFYSLLLHAYPARLRNEAGSEMLQLFADQLADARARGTVKRFYFQMLLDWFKTVIVQRVAQFSTRRQRLEPVPIHRLLRRGLVFAPNVGAAILITAGVLAYRGIRKLNKGLR